MPFQAGPTGLCLKIGLITCMLTCLPATASRNTLLFCIRYSPPPSAGPLIYPQRPESWLGGAGNQLVVVRAAPAQTWDIVSHGASAAVLVLYLVFDIII